MYAPATLPCVTCTGALGSSTGPSTRTNRLRTRSSTRSAALPASDPPAVRAITRSRSSGVKPGRAAAIAPSACRCASSSPSQISSGRPVSVGGASDSRARPTGWSRIHSTSAARRPGTVSTSPMSSSGSGGSPNASASSSPRHATISRHTPWLPREFSVATVGRSPAKACSSAGAGALVVRSRATPGGYGPGDREPVDDAGGNVVQGEHHPLQPAVLSRPPGRGQQRAVEGSGRLIGVRGDPGRSRCRCHRPSRPLSPAVAHSRPARQR